MAMAMLVTRVMHCTGREEMVEMMAPRTSTSDQRTLYSKRIRASRVALANPPVWVRGLFIIAVLFCTS